MRNLLVAIVAIATISAFGRDLPILNGRLEGDLNANGHMVTNLAPPTATNDAATKGYVDGATNGLRQVGDLAVCTNAVTAEGITNLVVIDRIATTSDVNAAIASMPAPNTLGGGVITNENATIYALTRIISGIWIWELGNFAADYNPSSGNFEAFETGMGWVATNGAPVGARFPLGGYQWIIDPATSNLTKCAAPITNAAVNVDTNGVAISVGADKVKIGEQTLTAIIDERIPPAPDLTGLASNAVVNLAIGNAAQAGTNYTDSKIAAIPAPDLSGIQSSISTLNLGYTRLYNFSTAATNAHFSATNYPPTAEAAAARCHYQPEPGMDFSLVPASLQLNEFRDGVWRTVVDTRDWTVWYWRFKEVQLTNDIAQLKAENTSLSNRLANAQSWANHTADGIENPMSDTLVVDRPNMWLMAGYAWQKCVSGSNSCFVIRANNVVLGGGANTNGFLEICDAFGKPYMRINKSSESFADPVFEEIVFDNAEGAWYIIFGNTTKPTKGGANVALAGTGTGKYILYDEDDPECPATITWPDTAESYAGHWIMKAVPKPVEGVIPSPMFFGAEIKVPGRDYVEYVKEAEFAAGIRVGDNVYEAVESGNTLIWTKRND